MKRLFYFFTLTLLFSSCVAVKEVPDVVAITQNHSRIAVMPIRATVERKIWMSNEKYLDLCQKKSEEIQLRVYRQLEHYGRDGRIHAEIMAPDEVNSMLFGIGFPNTSLTNFELCSLLQVDALVWGNIDIREPVSEAAAMALSNNSWIIPITNQVEITLKLYDRQTDTQLWSAYTSRSGQMGSLKRKMQMDVCRRATRNIPYNIKKKKYKKAYLNLQSGV
ncbi:MAG: hypothetical protein ACKOWW_03605 [Flavobacteriales bacterium]